MSSICCILTGKVYLDFNNKYLAFALEVSEMFSADSDSNGLNFGAVNEGA